MSTWQEFYNEIRDPSWPDCPTEQDFVTLPEAIQQECQNHFGYKLGQFAKTSKLINRRFPIISDTSCQLKWNWSTIVLAREETSSCHRTNYHKFDTEQFDFHNTPSKLDDRKRMLAGEWPERGCEYCKDIEKAGGASDRITNLDFPGIHAPVEFDQDPTAINVTPRILEVYFDNTCNLKCLYCKPQFSSLWVDENRRYPSKYNFVQFRPFEKSKNIEENKQKLFDWLRKHGQHLTNFNILGGEPLYQAELDQCLELFEQHPAPELKLQIFTNLNARLDRLQGIVERVKKMVDAGKIREFEVTASLDCWGPEQEYVRYPLDLKVWERNFEYLVSQNWINLIVSSTITPLTVKTLPDLLIKINTWNQTRRVYHYQNSVNTPSFMFIDIFGDIFQQDFEKALSLKATNTTEEQLSKNYLAGIAKQSVSKDPNIEEIKNLYEFLNEMDGRRSTNWRQVFPWLEKEFKKYSLIP